jgi:hypothetical protein
LIGAPVRRDIEWTEKLGDDQPPVIYRVSLFAGKVAWQRKSKGADEWETPKILPESAWNSLLEEMEKRYHRRRARHEDLLLVRSVAARSPKLP